MSGMLKRSTELTRGDVVRLSSRRPENGAASCQCLLIGAGAGFGVEVTIASIAVSLIGIAPQTTPHGVIRRASGWRALEDVVAGFAGIRL